MFVSISKILNPYYQTAVTAIAEVLARIGAASAAASPAKSKDDLNCLIQNSGITLKRSVLTRNCQDLAKALGRPVRHCETKIPFNIRMEPTQICETKP